MKTTVNKQPVSSVIQSKTAANRQAPAKLILQRYQNKTVQRQDIDEEDLLQGKFEDTAQRMELDELDEEIPLQRKSINNTGLPDNLKTGIENISGFSMDDVRVHYNSDKPAQLQALAYTQGTDIHMGRGQEKHLAHEAWHVVQQKQGRVQPTMQLQGVNVNDNEGLEREADVMGRKVNSLDNKMNYIQFKPNSEIGIVQYLPEPGVGIEMESGTIKLESTKRDSDDISLLDGHELKGKSIYPNEKIAEFEETRMWSLTAEVTGYDPKLDERKLAIEIIIHGGGDKKGVKLNSKNKGILQRIAYNLMRHMEYWEKYWTVTDLLGGIHWQIKNHRDIMKTKWSLQITSPVPLDTMQNIINKEYNDTSIILSDRKATHMISISEEIFKDTEFPKEIYENKEFLGLMSLICSYAEQGKNMTPGNKGLKHLTPIMPRTSFVGMIKTLPITIYKALMENDGILFINMAMCAMAKCNVTENATLYWEGLAKDAPSFDEWLLNSGRHLPPNVAKSLYLIENTVKLKVFDWIENLGIGIDKITEFDFSNRYGQIGGIGETVEYTLDGKTRKAPIFEFRDAESISLSEAPQTFHEIEREVREILGDCS